MEKLEVFEKVLTNPFSNNNYIEFTREFLNNVELVAPNRYIKEYSNFSFYVDGYYHIGNYMSDDGYKIAIFSVCLKRGDTVERARGIQRNFVKPLIQNGECAGAIVAFFTLDRDYEKEWTPQTAPGTQDESDKWRLSFIRMDYEFSKGKVSEKLTPAKRYSYLVGKGEPCHTAKERLYPIFSDDAAIPGIDDLEEAFSVESVTKEFFDLYRAKYHDLKEWLEGNEDFMQEAEIRNFTSEQFAKKLLGQIVFLYFIQKKGWLGVDAIPTTMTEKAYKDAFFSRGSKSREIMPKVYSQQQDGSYRIVISELQKLSPEDEEFLAGIVKGKPWGSGPKDFMRRMFVGCVDANRNYFDDYLEPLFYTGLNKNRGENGFYAPLHRRIPFLNGGLFEPIDNYEWENNNFAIPNYIFSNADEKGRDADGILDIFDRYNFTMNEDEPMEREVAIDPEMLGKVFENLLDVKDRKSKGAFYTPREIVHYMCQESLINHIVTKTGLPEQDIREFVLYGDLMRDEDTTKQAREGNKELLISSNIYSPASGVNRLKEIDEVLENVKVADLAVGSGAFPLGMLNEIVKARETLSAYMSIGMNAFQKRSFYAFDRRPYNLKVNTIKNCIFACDIEPSAVDIAKLRLWLSIVIDDEIVENPGNNEFDEHTKPRQLPNLDCNIICGNSLVDEFMGLPLLSESDLLHNVSADSQVTMFQGGFDSLLSELIKLQDKLFFIKDHDEKEEIKSSIQDIYNRIVVEQLQGNPKVVEAYYDAINEPSRPFIIWQLYFPSVFRDNGGFDIVIGNPPYIDSEGMVNSGLEWERDYISKRYKYAKGNWDIYISFFEKGLSLLEGQGCLIFITPDKWISKPFGKALRVGETDKIIQIMEVGRDVFESALVDSIVTMIGKIPTDSINVFKMKKSEGVAHFVRRVSKNLLNEDCALDIVFSDYTEYIEKMSKNPSVLGDFFQCENACATSDCYTMKEILFSHDDAEQFDKQNEYKVINTGTIGRYVSRWGYVPMKYLKDSYAFPVVNKNDFHTTFPKSYGEKPKKKKVIIKGLTLLDGTLDFDGIIVPGKTTMIVPVDNDDELKVVGAYINSKIAIFYIKQRYSSSSYNGGITFTKDMINNLPWVNIETPVKQRIVSLVDNILAAKNNDIEYDISEYEAKIDEIFYSLYGFNTQEVENIENSLLK